MLSHRSFSLVRERRLELPRRLTHAPQTCLSTCSSTLAFRSARAIIAENLPCYAITGYKNWEENTFVTMPYFTSYSKNDSYRNSGFVNVSPEALTDNDSIIAHASKEVPEGYNASALYTERFGDGYMVMFSYKLEDYSVGEYIFVIMSNDGITECISYRPFGLANN